MVKVLTTAKKLDCRYLFLFYGVVIISCVYNNNFRRELSGFDLAKCNDGSTAAYFHQQVNIHNKILCINKLFIVWTITPPKHGTLLFQIVYQYQSKSMKFTTRVMHMHISDIKKHKLFASFITEENLRRETPSRRITVTSYLKEILTGQLRCIGLYHWDRYTRVPADRENWNRGERCR